MWWILWFEWACQNTFNITCDAEIIMQMQRIANAQKVSISKLLSHYKELICNVS